MRAAFGLTLLARSLSSAAASSTPRLYAPSQALAASAALTLKDEQRHYLLSVMRLKPGSEIMVFNGVDGEWLASVEELDRKRCALRVVEQTRPQPGAAAAAREPTLLFGVLKGQRLPTLIEKCTELGVGTLQPVVTNHCAARKLNAPRLQAIAVEAAEQSGRLTVPTVQEPLPSLASALSSWDEAAPLYVCDERRDAPPLSAVHAAAPSTDAAPGLLIGPEGGFSVEEFEELDRFDFVTRVSLGQNILRAETAALAACAILNCR